jgi:hypothetical protein
MLQTCVDEWRRGARAAAVLAGALALAGCSSSSTGSPDSSPSLTSRLSGYFGSSKQTPATPAAPAQPIAATVDCPGVDIRQGAATLMIAAKGTQTPTAADLRYQLSFSQFARECRSADGSFNIKVGVQGRVVLGPQGGPGNVEVPLRYAVVREGPEPKMIVTRFKRIPITVGPNDNNVPFTDVEDGLTFPVPPAAELEAYVIYVGFDEIGEKPARPAPKTAKQRQPKTQ